MSQPQSRPESEPEAESAAVYSVDHRLSYADCDPAGIVYYATWFPLMERTHTEWWLSMGYRFDTFGGTYGAVPVTRHTECSYLSVTRLFDLVRCSMRIEAVGRTSYRLGFEFTRSPEGERVAYGRLTLVSIDGAGKPVPVPPPLRELLVRHR
ncbi:MAG: thioesterase family protein [Nocardiopsaceae bacterium]|nr:thioesterase family protein [Nocardiopsaceae bacterium]